MNLSPSTVSSWLKEFEPLCRFGRLRAFAIKLYAPKDMILTKTLRHRQVYRYQFHRAKCQFLVDLTVHRRFYRLQRFLERIPDDVPNDYFTDSDSLRSSQSALTFSQSSMIVRSKTNYATRLAAFSLQSARNRISRHETVEEFMLANDSVTVACEVPIFVKRADLEHMREKLGFEMYASREELAAKNKNPEARAKYSGSGSKTASLPDLITGHIDLLQIRNGYVHILDYKPSAAKEHPIEQLTVYAIALARRTGLRLYDFVCAWFDEVDYFEFYPLHVVSKPAKETQGPTINTREGEYGVSRNPSRIINLHSGSIVSSNSSGAKRAVEA